MVSSQSKSHFLCLSFFTLILFVQSTPTLLQSDENALPLILKNLGFYNPNFTKNHCNSTGIFCEEKIFNSSPVLRVTRLVFNSQKLNGRISPTICLLSELKELSLQNNELTGKLPSQIVHCHKLEVLNLGKNRFLGEIPSGFSLLNRLRVIDLSSNKFVGSLSFLKHFPNLEKLNLASNLFEGKIPLSLKSFRNLRFLNLSGNSLLEGQIPVLRQLDDLSVETESLPKRYVLIETSNGRNDSNNAMAPSSFSGNAEASSPLAAIAPSSFSGNAEAPSPLAAMPQRHRRNRRNRRKRIVGLVFGFLAGSIAGIVSGLVFSFLYKLLSFLVKGRGKDSSLKIFSPMIKKPENLAFLEKDDGLANLDVIGKGGCGEVYKGVLPGSNGKEIAIKKIIQPATDADELSDEDSKLLTKKMRQVRSEIQTVGQIRHRNLVSLLAHLPRPDCHFLVYEYMKNGSLQDWLQQGRDLDWLSRHKIALGVVAGLEYLHMSHAPRIIHRDLKPANILLDDEMEARIADFGLAKAVPDAHTHVSTSHVAGTVGYIAPEYYQTFKFTDKCDMYSFGVVLGVLVTGKMPSDNFFQATDEMSLVKWMRNVMTSEYPKKAIDPKLLGNGYEEQMLLVLKVACFCTLDNPKERPNSKDARCMLSQVKH